MLDRNGIKEYDPNVIPMILGHMKWVTKEVINIAKRVSHHELENLSEVEAEDIKISESSLRIAMDLVKKVSIERYFIFRLKFFH